MKTNAYPASTVQLLRALLMNARLMTAGPRIDWFLLKYLSKFTVVDVDGKLVLHSHMPPLNSKAYRKFVRQHVLSKSIRPSHAQIGVTNACPQGCEYCYSKNRRGTPMDFATICATIDQLTDLGVFWLGLTGGEPLLNRHLPHIVERAGEECSVKLFTTGVGLTSEKVRELKSAGLFSVSVSMDHPSEDVHDRIRKFPGAHRAAMDALQSFLSVGGIHVGVSAVLSREMLREPEVERFLEFLEGLGIHEAWLSEAKPSSAESWREGVVITSGEREMLIRIQERHNRRGGMTVNYLGHFEDARAFGCTAGHKMVYVDAFGEVSPCVFLPMSFGNVSKTPLKEIYSGMVERFPVRSTCFVNSNVEVLSRHYRGQYPISREESESIAGEAHPYPPSQFFKLLYR